MNNKATHIATHKKSGKKTEVYLDEEAGVYKENWMVCLKDVDTVWDIKPIEDKAN